MDSLFSPVISRLLKPQSFLKKNIYCICSFSEQFSIISAVCFKHCIPREKLKIIFKRSAYFAVSYVKKLALRVVEQYCLPMLMLVLLGLMPLNICLLN